MCLFEQRTKSLFSFSERMAECSEFPHAYDNPSSISSPARPVSRLPPYTHHRTSSNVSNASTSSQSNVNPTFRLEDEEDYSLYSPGHYYQRTPNVISNVGTYSSSVLNHEYGSIAGADTSKLARFEFEFGRKTEQFGGGQSTAFKFETIDPITRTILRTKV